MTPHEVKFQLEQKLQELEATVTDIHSITTEGNTVFAAFDITDPTGDMALLFFEFERPQLVSPADVREFCGWIAQTGHHGETVH